ncbi:Uncharacterised protein [Bordetella pertussis]|nr:Uncharacterised protein [Bordetella pertussis]
MVAWIIMAPEILASARRSLPCRTQIRAFMISGSSVATGASSRAATCGEAPMARPSSSIWRTNTCEASAITASASTVCAQAQNRLGLGSRGRSLSGSRSSQSRHSSSRVSSRLTYSP